MSVDQNVYRTRHRSFATINKMTPFHNIEQLHPYLIVLDGVADVEVVVVIEGGVEREVDKAL